MKLAIIAVGSVKDRNLREACGEYLKRMNTMQPVEIIEIAEDYIPDERNRASVMRALEREGKRVLSCLRRGDVAVAMTPRGNLMDSLTFSNMLDPSSGIEGTRLVFIIGSSYGLGPEVYAHCQWELSMGPMTFPHQLARLMLLEQIYWGQMILRGSAYHK